MLEKLVLKNVGPAPEMELEFGSRVNIITGDNGLGKSFILDCAWFVLTGNWLAKSNQQMQHGGMARPNSSEKLARIVITLSNFESSYAFSSEYQNWTSATTSGLHAKSDLILQVCPDGEFGIFDLYRAGTFGFSISEVWNGLTHLIPIWGDGNSQKKNCV